MSNMSDDASIRRTNLKALNLKASDLSARIGSSQSYWRDLMAIPTKSFGEKVARKIEDALGLPRGCMDDPGMVIDDLPLYKPPTEPLDSSIAVPLLSTKASMGSGYDRSEDAIVGTLRLSPHWINESIRPSPDLSRLRFIHGHGDSMRPTIESGDILLVDAGINTITVDGVYVMEANDRLYIKRVRQRLDGAFEISSDNPLSKTVDVLNGTHQVTVLGRVIWVWNGRKL